MWNETQKYTNVRNTDIQKCKGNTDAYTIVKEIRNIYKCETNTEIYKRERKRIMHKYEKKPEMYIFRA